MHDLTRQLQQRLDCLLRRFPGTSRLVVAYSGGLDSSALLHAVSVLCHQPGTYPGPLCVEAVHVNHGLNPESGRWAEHCRKQCRSLGIVLHCRTVQVDGVAVHDGSDARKIPEARARDARYRAFAEILDENSVLLLAHHQDDQAETILMRLMRGAGPAGLSGMPAERRLGRGWLWRPLLELPRRSLEEYVAETGLQWVEDDSNADLRMDRNHVRHHILPGFSARWPSWRDQCLLSARLCARAARLNEELALIDLESVRSARVPFTPPVWQVACDALLALSKDRQYNVLRYWLQKQTGTSVNEGIVARILSEVIPARHDRSPELPLSGHRLHRHRRTLCLVPGLEAVDRDWFVHWMPRQDGERISVPGNGELVACRVSEGGVPEGVRLKVRYRKRGERCQLPSRPRRAMSRVLQEHVIPVWWRDRLPLVTVDDEVAWIPGVGACLPGSMPGQSGWVFHWMAPGCEHGGTACHRENTFVDGGAFW